MKARFIQVGLFAVAMLVPGLLAVIVTEFTLAADECLDYPDRLGSIASLSYGLTVGMGILVLGGSIRKAAVCAVATAIGLAMVWSLALSTLWGAIDRGRQKVTMADLRRAGAAVEAFRAETGRLPEGLAQAGVHRPRDGWGTAFDYMKRENSYVLRSRGACGQSDYADPFLYPSGATTKYVADIVYRDGRYVAWPEGLQR